MLVSVRLRVYSQVGRLDPAPTRPQLRRDVVWLLTDGPRSDETSNSTLISHGQVATYVEPIEGKLF